MEDSDINGVVGIAALVAQCLEGILMLRKLVRSLTHTSFKTLGDFLERIESLEATLKAVHELNQRFPSRWSEGSAVLAIEPLVLQSKKCRDDIIGWVKDAEKMNPKYNSSVSIFRTRIGIAGNRDAISEFHRKVATHQQVFQSSLEVLGRSFDIVSREQDIMLNEKLDRLESSTVQSSASMSSIASDVSRVLEILSAAQESSHEPDNATVGDAKPDFEMEAPVLGPIKSTSEDKHDSKHVEWCCDALPGIEAAFETRFDGYGCCYCGSSLGKEEITWHDRGKHLVEVHNFGRCNLLFAYRTADQFMQHMRDCHRMFIRNDNFILQHERITRKLDFQRGLSSNTQALAKTDEYAQTRGLYMAQLKAIIEASKKSNSMSHSIKSHSEIVEGDERLWQLMWDVARLQEEFIVDGHNISSYYSGCETLEHEFWKLDCSELATHSLVQPSLQTWRTDLLSHEPYFPNSYHMRLSVLAIGSASFSPLLSETRPSDGRIRRRHSISEWLYEILSQSWTTRILVREMIGRGTFQLHETLSYWYKDEVIEEPERHCEESNGALDSRDSHKTAWLLPPRDDGKGPHAGEDRSSSDQV